MSKNDRINTRPPALIFNDSALNWTEKAEALLDSAQDARARLAKVEALIESGPYTWQGYLTHDIGHAFLADTVTDWVDDLRAALAAEPDPYVNPRDDWK